MVHFGAVAVRRRDVAFPFKDPVKGPICAVCCVQCVPNAGCMKPAFSNQEMARV